LLIDAHTHVDRYDLVGAGAVESALAEIEQHQILTISNSMDPDAYHRNLEIAQHCHLVLPIFGVHPWQAPDWAGRLEALRPATEASPMLGEIGLDHHFVDDPAAYPAQQQVLEYFLAAACDQDKVVHLHTKGAEGEVLDLLERYGVRRAVVHWYSGPLDLFRAFAARGCYFTVGPEVSYSDHIRAIACEIPAGRLLTETDNPGGPKGYIGAPGMPGLIERVVEAVAQARGASAAAVAGTVQENLLRLLEGEAWIPGRWLALLEQGTEST
jgi:TatD DNase family protein